MISEKEHFQEQVQHTIQHDNVAGLVPKSLPAQSKLKARPRSLPVPTTTLVRFTGQRKSSREAFSDYVTLAMSLYNDVLHFCKVKHGAFYLATSSRKRLLP